MKPSRNVLTTRCPIHTKDFSIFYKARTTRPNGYGDSDVDVVIKLYQTFYTRILTNCQKTTKSSTILLVRRGLLSFGPQADVNKLSR